MANSVSCGAPWFADGLTWSGLLTRKYDCGPSVADSGASALALTPASGVFAAQAANMKVLPPVSGLSVTVSPGYCMVPAAAGQGGYKFGLMSSGVLTVAANASGNPRVDLIVAQAHDTNNSSSFADVNIITGTPAASPAVPATPATAIALAKVAVANGASSIVAGNITDLRPFTCAPGGILHLPSAAAAIAAPASQFYWQADIARLVHGTGSAGTVAAYSGQPAGAIGYAPGVTSDPSLTFTADGMTDFEIYYARESSGTDENEQVYVRLLIDGHTVDTTYAWDQFAHPGRLAVTYYTSSRQGTTPSKGTHTVALSGSDDNESEFFFGSDDNAKMTLRIQPVAT